MKPWMWHWASTIATLLAAIATVHGAEEFTFDAAQFEKKPFEFSGYIELKHESFDLNQGSAFYTLNYLGQAQRCWSVIREESNYQHGRSNRRRTGGQSPERRFEP